MSSIAVPNEFAAAAAAAAAADGSAAQSPPLGQNAGSVLLGAYAKQTEAKKAQALAAAAELKANPNSVAAQNKVAAVLNDPETATLLRNDKAFAAQFLAATGGKLHMAVGAYLALRPKGKNTEAIGLIGQTPFATTAEGQKVLLKTLTLERTGRIRDGKPGEVGESIAHFNPNTGEVVLSSEKSASRTPADIATDLTHEATHACYEQDYPAGNTSNIDNEQLAFRNQNVVGDHLRAQGHALQGAPWVHQRSDLRNHSSYGLIDEHPYRSPIDPLLKGKGDGDEQVGAHELAPSRPLLGDGLIKGANAQQIDFLLRAYSTDGVVNQDELHAMYRDGVVTKDANGNFCMQPGGLAFLDMLNSPDPKVKEYGAWRLGRSMLGGTPGDETTRTIDKEQFKSSLTAANGGVRKGLRARNNVYVDQAYAHYAGADGRLDIKELKQMSLDGVLGKGQLQYPPRVTNRTGPITGLVVNWPPPKQLAA
jgi:hypothetical protein